MIKLLWFIFYVQKWRQGESIKKTNWQTKSAINETVSEHLVQNECKYCRWSDGPLSKVFKLHEGRLERKEETLAVKISVGSAWRGAEVHCAGCSFTGEVSGCVFPPMTYTSSHDIHLCNTRSRKFYSLHLRKIRPAPCQLLKYFLKDCSFHHNNLAAAFLSLAGSFLTRAPCWFSKKERRNTTTEGPLVSTRCPVVCRCRHEFHILVEWNLNRMKQDLGEARLFEARLPPILFFTE